MPISNYITRFGLRFASPNNYYMNWEGWKSKSSRPILPHDPIQGLPNGARCLKAAMPRFNSTRHCTWMDNALPARKRLATSGSGQDVLVIPRENPLSPILSLLHQSSQLIVVVGVVWWFYPASDLNKQAAADAIVEATAAFCMHAGILSCRDARVCAAPSSFSQALPVWKVDHGSMRVR